LREALVVMAPLTRSQGRSVVQVWRGLAQVPVGYGPSVVTIGNFDGVHRGHQTVLTRLAKDAANAGCSSVAITFSPHPLHVHRPDDAPPLVTGDTDRLELLGATGLDAVLLCEYTLQFAEQSPEDFVRT
jgi:riboflavin kinase / FMN adenylyltransferase